MGFKDFGVPKVQGDKAGDERREATELRDDDEDVDESVLAAANELKAEMRNSTVAPVVEEMAETSGGGTPSPARRQPRKFSNKSLRS